MYPKIILFAFALLFPLLTKAQITTIVKEEPRPNISEDEDLMTVQYVLLRQQDDWNKGDIDAFMEGYWKSEKLQFIGGSGVTYGWKNTLENYKKRYPDRAAMGKLTFDIINVEKLSKKSIMLVGKWHLQREKDNPKGHFMLIWKKIGRSWVIIADHTSLSSS